MRRLAALVVAAVLLPLAAAAQQEPSPVLLQDVDVDGFPVVRTLVTAVSPGTLDAGAFTLFEGDVPYPADSAEPVGGDEIEAVLVMDTSGSMAGEPLDAAKEAAIAFLAELPASTEVAVVGFGSEAEVVQELTDDRDAVTDAINGLAAAGETALYDAILLGLDQFDPGGADNLVVLTDGADTVSTASLEDAQQGLEAYEGAFFAVELEAAENDPEALAALAEAGNGLVAPAADPDALAEIYAQIAVAVTSQYVVSYTSSGSGVQQLRVEVEGVGASATVPIGLPAAVSSTTTAPTTTTTTVPPTVPPGTTTEPPFFFDGPWLLIGLAAVFVGLSGILFFLASPGEGRGAAVRPTFRRRSSQALSGVSRGLVTAAERGSDGRSKGLDQTLDRAGIRLRAGEWIVVFAALALLALAIGWLAAETLVGGLVAFLVVGVVGWLIPKVAGDRRQKKFEDQLPDMLAMLASTIRTGYAPIQASELVAREFEEPTKTELGRAVAETRLGRDYIDALGGIADRMESEDFRWVVEAMAINRDVGGDVSEILDQVADTIRARIQLRRQIDALSAEGRLSAWILVAVPFFLAWWLWRRDPEYLLPLTETVTGLVMIIGAAILMVIGIIVIRNIIKIED